MKNKKEDKLALKKVGIVCDNYKLDTFKERLLGLGIKFKTAPLTKDTTAITLTVSINKLLEIKKVCEEIERIKNDI